MLTLKALRRNGCTTIEEIDHATIDKADGCLWYTVPSDVNQDRKLLPDEVSQAFIMNENGKTVLSHDFGVLIKE